MKHSYFTLKGLESLKKEYGSLKKNKRPRFVKRLAQAREMGDLSENSEYTSSREALSMLDMRIKEIGEVISKAKIIKNNNLKGKKRRIVDLGCKVTVEINEKTYVFTIVGEWEADPFNKKISHNSPLGKALLGKKVGDAVEVEAPAGKIVYEIKKIH